MGLVVLLGPRHLAPAKVGPEVDGRAQMFITAAPQVDFEDLAGLKADRSGAGHALQALRIFKNTAIASQLAQKPRRQFGTGSRQRTEEVLVWMFFKELLDGLPIFAQLLFHGFEGGDQRQGQAALGAGNGFSSTKLLRPGEEAQALLVGLGTSESVGVQELFPAAFAGFAQGLGSGKALDKVP